MRTSLFKSSSAYYDCRSVVRPPSVNYGTIWLYVHAPILAVSLVPGAHRNTLRSDSGPSRATLSHTTQGYLHRILGYRFGGKPCTSCSRSRPILVDVCNVVRLSRLGLSGPVLRREPTVEHQCLICEPDLGSASSCRAYYSLSATVSQSLLTDSRTGKRVILWSSHIHPNRLRPTLSRRDLPLAISSIPQMTEDFLAWRDPPMLVRTCVPFGVQMTLLR